MHKTITVFIAHEYFMVVNISIKKDISSFLQIFAIASFFPLRMREMSWLSVHRVRIAPVAVRTLCMNRARGYSYFVYE